MNKQEAQIKQPNLKLVKRVSANKTKLQSKQASGEKLEAVKTVGLGCVPVGIR